MSGRGVGIRVARGFDLGAVTIPAIAAAHIGLDKPRSPTPACSPAPPIRSEDRSAPPSSPSFSSVPRRLIPATPHQVRHRLSRGPPGSPHSPCSSHYYFQGNTVRCWKHEPDGPRRAPSARSRTSAPDPNTPGSQAPRQHRLSIPTAAQNVRHPQNQSRIFGTREAVHDDDAAHPSPIGADHDPPTSDAKLYRWTAPALRMTKIQQTVLPMSRRLRHEYNMTGS
jgi:hypothetical protein